MCRVATFVSDLIQYADVTCSCCRDHLWSRFEAVAQQALVPLHWLVGNNHLMSRPCWCLPTAELQLAEALWELLHDCLMRFLPDQSLDVQQMLTQTLMVATPSLQQPALQNCQPLTDVVAAVLKRIA